MARKRTNPNFQNGVPELLALRLLSEREMYGYELVKRIHEVTEERLSYGEGSVYPVLHELERQKFLKSRRQAVNGRTRTYYRVTPTGRRRLRELADDWSRTVEAVSLAFGEGH